MPDPRPVVFLDRDGTLCEEMGYINHLSRFRMFPYAPAAVRRLNEAGILVIVITNQSGIARGFFPESVLQEVHEKMAQDLAAGGAHVDAIYYCPHGAEHSCGCRKPRPGLIERAAREHLLKLEHSWVVGDRYVDVEMAHAVGGRGILVLTGYGRGDYELHRNAWPRQPEFVAENLTIAVDAILEALR